MLPKADGIGAKVMPPEPAAVSPLRKLGLRLDSVRAPTRLHAMRDARALEPEMFVELMSACGALYRKRVRGTVVGTLATLSVFCAFIEIYSSDHYLQSDLFMGLAATALIGAAVIHRIVPRRARNCASALLGERHDLRCIAPAIALVAELETDGRDRRVICAWLSEMLESVDVNDRNLLRPDSLDSLAALLTRVGNPGQLHYAILCALGQIGAEQQIPDVRRFERWMGVRGVKGFGAAVHDCLELLQMRADETLQARTLLRPSAANAANPLEMLRPASGLNPASEDLLRPSDADDGAGARMPRVDMQNTNMPYLEAAGTRMLEMDVQIMDVPVMGAAEDVSLLC